MDDYATESEASVHTMSTIQSDQVAEYFRSIHGFQYEADEAVPRLLSSNMTWEKIDIIYHIVFRLVRNGMNVPPLVDQMLRGGRVDGNQEPWRILEVVTNNGIWVQEMAETYPSALFVSIDTKPLVAHKPHARINYEVYDLHAGIIEPDCSFDLVFTRYGNLVTKDFNFLLQELHRVLKPNGFLLIDTPTLNVYEGANADVPLYSATHYVEGLKFTRKLMENQGADSASWDDLTLRLEPSHFHWQNNQSSLPYPQGGVIDPIRGFHSIDLRIEKIPLGRWSENEGEKIIGGLVQLIPEICWRNHLPNMLAEGIAEDEAKIFIDNVLQDLADIDKYKSYYEVQLLCAQRI